VISHGADAQEWRNNKLKKSEPIHTDDFKKQVKKK
jgi:hypothetical protein